MISLLWQRQCVKPMRRSNNLTSFNPSIIVSFMNKIAVSTIAWKIHDDEKYLQKCCRDAETVISLYIYFVL